MAKPPIRYDEPLARDQGVCVIVHGLAEHSGRYAHVQGRLAGAGYRSFAFDLRGHGEAEGWPGKVASPDDWLEDLDAVLREAMHETTVPLFLVGHSMGTLIALAYLAERGQDDVTGLVLSGTAVAPGSALLEAMAAGSTAIPAPAICRDPEVVRAYVSDPLVFAADVPPECGAAAMMCSARAYEGASKISLPVLLLHGSADAICDPSGAQDVLGRLASQDKTIKMYNGLYHEVFNEPERDQVLSDMIGWLDAHV